MPQDLTWCLRRTLTDLDTAERPGDLDLPGYRLHPLHSDRALDASVLYPALLRDLLLELAVSGPYRAKWSVRVNDEWTRALLRNRPDLTAARLERTRHLMDAHVRDVLVAGFEGLVPFAGRGAGARSTIRGELSGLPGERTAPEPETSCVESALNTQCRHDDIGRTCVAPA